MIQFPKLPAPAYPLSEEREDNVLRSSFENGSVMTRRKFTRQRKRWPSINWKAMAELDWLALENFYTETTASGSLFFEWEHPVEKRKYTVRFSEPPKSILIVVKTYQIEIALEEV